MNSSLFGFVSTSVVWSFWSMSRMEIAFANEMTPGTSERMETRKH